MDRQESKAKMWYTVFLPSNGSSPRYGSAAAPHKRAKEKKSRVFAAEEKVKKGFGGNRVASGGIRRVYLGRAV